MENFTHSFTEANLVLQLIQKLQIESKAVITWSFRNKKEGIFWTVYFVRRKFCLTFVFYLNVWCIEYKLRTLLNWSHKNLIKIAFGITKIQGIHAHPGDRGAGRGGGDGLFLPAANLNLNYFWTACGMNLKLYGFS